MCHIQSIDDHLDVKPYLSVNKVRILQKSNNDVLTSSDHATFK